MNPAITHSPKVISVASGKGGTGKTTVAVSLALALGQTVFVDCDVEEPNSHLFLKPVLDHIETAHVLIPRIDEEKCAFCGLCGEVCSYGAIAVLPDREELDNRGDAKGRVLLFDHLCHGCGACSRLCPRGAIEEVPKPIGTIEAGHAGDIRFVHGRLSIGEVMSPPLIRQVRRSALSTNGYKRVIIDAPPGTACPMVASVKGTDFCLLVTEPTPFGLSDLRLTVDVVRKIGIPFGVLINRDGIGDGGVDQFCRNEGIDIVMRIPYDREIARFYAEGVSLLGGFPRYRAEFAALLETVTG
jgi:MinD superfamily P-loop ATPase